MIVRKWVSVPRTSSIISRGVCVDCNTGWMSRLEGRAKPHLLPLIRGVETDLTPAVQVLLSTWAVKTAMVLELTGASSRTRYFMPEERQRFSLLPTPPASAVVFAAGYVGSVAFSSRECPLVFEDAALRFDGYPSTMTFGALVLQVLSHRGPGSTRGLRVAHDFRLAEIQLWPTRAAVRWPPEEVFDDLALDQYQGRWVTRAGTP